MITINISRGWDFTDDEKIYGWRIKLSISWIIEKPEKIKIELEIKSFARWLSIKPDEAHKLS